MAPSKLPRWRSPVGWIPETTRIASADIGVRPPSPEERAKLLLVGPAEDPHQREVHGHPATDERSATAAASPPIPQPRPQIKAKLSTTFTTRTTIATFTGVAVSRRA